MRKSCKKYNNYDMKGKAIVMGATSGIGMHTALLLAQQGWQVAIAGRRIERLKEVKQMADNNAEATANGSNGRIAAYKQIDITSDNAPALLGELIDELGGMDLYLHSSGIGWQNNLLDADKELATVETNAMGFVRMTDAAFNWMAEHGTPGHIACITSIAGTKGLGAAPAYSATKRMQTHYIECLAQQARMRQLPIRLTDIRPGFVRTDLIAGSIYPMQLDAHRVAAEIVRTIESGKEVKTIDWRYALLTSLWRMVPRWMWTRMTWVR